jgi:beta-lactamase superfamily II metal-dependent hydrolase
MGMQIGECEMFSIEMLPARYGDSLWIEYGEAQSPRRILIDGGKAGTCKAIIQRANAVHGKCEIELLVVTHIDADHIDGIVKLLKALPLNINIKEIWFNGWDHINQRLGGPGAEYLTHYIQDLKSQGLTWNEKFDGQAVVIPQVGGLPQKKFADGMVLTVLSPTWQGLKALIPKWQEDCIKAHILPGSAPEESHRRKVRLGGGIDVQALAKEDFTEDDSPSNGSSIALLARFDGKSCLLAGDAFPSVLVEAIRTRMRKDPLRVNAFKLAHHGSKNNTSLELAELVVAEKYLISTNGLVYAHPDPEAISRILKTKTTHGKLYFNYLNEDMNGVWKDPILESDWGYEAHFPRAKTGGIKVEL